MSGGATSLRAALWPHGIYYFGLLCALLNLLGAVLLRGLAHSPQLSASSPAWMDVAVGALPAVIVIVLAVTATGFHLKGATRTAALLSMIQILPIAAVFVSLMIAAMVFSASMVLGA